MYTRPLVGVAVGLGIASQALHAENHTVAAIIANNPDPFAAVDVAAILAAYGSSGSGIEIGENSVDLDFGGIPLQLAANDIVGDASAIGGATGIISDPSGFGFTIGLSGDYLFAFDEFALTDDARTALFQVLELYKEYDGTDISVEGHTDSKGSDEYNQRLSEQRAGVVFDWFVANGIDAALLTASGFGEGDPVAPNEVNGEDNPDGRALNRRVDIRVTTLMRVNSVPLNRE